MDVEHKQAIQRPATLYLVGREACSCTIDRLTANLASLALHPDSPQSPVKSGDLAELHIAISGNTLVIKGSVDTTHNNHIEFKYIDVQDPGVRQLVNWFKQPPPAPPVPATEAALLKEMETTALQQLGELLEVFLDQSDDHLLRLAETATSNDQQNKLFEAKSALRQHREEIGQLFCHQLRQHFERPKQTVANSSDNSAVTHHEDMELVDLKSFEDWLSLEVIIRRAREHYFVALGCLQRRFSATIHETVNAEQLPIGVDVICQSFYNTLKNYTISGEMLPIIYRIFEEYVVRHLDDLYDTLNARFKSCGILPNIESQLLQERSQLTGITSTANKDTKPAPAGLKLPNNVVPINSDPALFNTVRDILALLKGETKSDASTAPDTGVPINPGQLLDGLEQMQHDQTAIDAIAEGASLQHWLQQTLNLSISGELAEVIQLISGVFATLEDYPQISGPILHQLNRLQIPIARVALADSSFFSAPDHPAKLLVNSLIELCLDNDSPNRSLENTLDAIITDIDENYSGDLATFERALADLAAITAQQHSAYARNTQRIAQTYEGRQRVQQAREAVDREIQRRLSPPQAPTVILELLDKGWRELLQLTYIKMGPESDTWRRHLDTLDQLLVWLNGDESAEVPKPSTSSSELEADSFADLLYQELSNVFPGDFRYQQSIEALREILRGNQPVEMTALSESEGDHSKGPGNLRKELEEANPQLTRWFKRAQSLEVGDEFTWLDDDTGQRNIKLAWISDNRQHFVFVNRRGQKVLDYDLVDLANELSRGLSPVEHQVEWPLVERSLYSTVQQAYEKLAYNSSHDELTGLVNRKECERRLNSALADAKTRLLHHSLLYIDLDNFSLVNNLHGHLAGDQLLIDAGKVLAEVAPENATVGRMGGNEYIILVYDSDLSESERIAGQVLQAVDQHNFQWQDHSFEFTASIGLVSIDKYTENVVDLVRNAISCCQSAKKSGGNRTISFRQDAALHGRREKLLSWIEKLNSVLESDKLCLRAQSIIPLAAGGPAHPHFEILLAIRNEQNELESPIEFIEAAECYNRMQRVDRWVVEMTFRWLAGLGLPVDKLPAVSINLSGNSLNDDQFIDYLLEQFAKYKVPTTNICFEVTETATIDNLAEAADFIREIKKIGCKFSLDDFGSGNASYQYLKHLPVDYLKIDGMFVREIDKSRNDYALVKSIHEIAHLMGKQTIAEFAESEAVIECLREIGVDYIQGFAVGKPIPLNELPTR